MRNVVVALVALIVLALVAGLGLFVLQNDDGEGGPGSTEPDRDGSSTVDPDDGSFEAMGARAFSAEDMQFADEGEGDAASPDPIFAEEHFIDPVQDRPTSSGDPVAPPANGAPWFTFTDYEKTLVAIDWSDVGRIYSEWLPLLSRIATASARNESPSNRDSEMALALQGELLMVVAPHEFDLPTSTGTSTITHPAFVSNAIASALYARGRGLDEAQLAKLKGLAETHVRRDGGRRAAQETRRWQLQDRIAEAGQRREFFLDVEHFLTVEQSRGLHTELTRGRVVLDPFSAAPVWEDVATPTPIMDEEENTAEAIYTTLFGAMGIPDRLRNDLMAHVRASIDSATLQAVSRSPRALDMAGFLRADHIQLGADWTIELWEGATTAANDGKPVELERELLSQPVVLLRYE